MSERTALYRLFAADDALLYVGVAEDPEWRWSQHSKEKIWWPQVARKEVQWYPSRDAAEAAEWTAIHEELPTYNLTVSPKLRSPEFTPPPLPVRDPAALQAIIEQIGEILVRRDISHAHVRLRVLNLLLSGHDELPRGTELAMLAGTCSMSAREAYKALALQRGGWPEGWLPKTG